MDYMTTFSNLREIFGLETWLMFYTTFVICWNTYDYFPNKSNK